MTAPAAGPKETPYWWEAAPRPALPERPLPRAVDIAVVGSGFTGLSAALALARAGRSVAVFDAEDAGHGASSRNAGFLGRTLKHGFGKLLRTHGLEQAVAIYRELEAALDHSYRLIEEERIACHFVRCGRFIAALDREQYDMMARELELRRRHLGYPFEMVGRADLAREIGSDAYYGGAVQPDLGAVHPGLLHRGLFERAQAAGADMQPRTPVTRLAGDPADGFMLATPRGPVAARAVVVATNGYTGALMPWLRRRLLPFSGYMVATEPLPPALLERLLPTGRTTHDYNFDIDFFRRAPDSPRLLFGGRTGVPARTLGRKAAILRRRLAAVFPELAEVGLSHVWTGRCAATFDLFPHIGSEKGVHYALGYCFAGVPMGLWFGHRLAERLLGRANAPSIFEDRPFPTLPLYRGRPWFLPLLMAYERRHDRPIRR